MPRRIRVEHTRKSQYHIETDEPLKVVADRVKRAAASDENLRILGLYEEPEAKPPEAA